MPKSIYCAECGTELIIIIKAIPSQGKTITLSPPHTCPDEEPELPFKAPDGELNLKPAKDKSDVLAGLDKLKFVSKLNKLPQQSINPVSEPGDKRSPDQIRPETTSIAPDGILGALKNKKG